MNAFPIEATAAINDLEKQLTEALNKIEALHVGYFSEPILVEGDFVSASDAWCRADDVIVEVGQDVGVRGPDGRIWWESEGGDR